MQTPLELVFHNVSPSEAVESDVQNRVRKLERRFDGVTSVHVAIEKNHREPRPVSPYHVRIEVRVPGKELVVSRGPGERGSHKDIHVAVRDAFDAVERQLGAYAQRLRRDVKHHEPALQGKIVRLFPRQRHGFIAATDGTEIYFHETSVVNEAFDDLEVGAAVELAMADGDTAEGPIATTVREIRPQQLREAPPALAAKREWD